MWWQWVTKHSGSPSRLGDFKEQCLFPPFGCLRRADRFSWNQNCFLFSFFLFWENKVISKPAWHTEGKALSVYCTQSFCNHLSRNLQHWTKQRTAWITAVIMKHWSEFLLKFIQRTSTGSYMYCIAWICFSNAPLFNKKCSWECWICSTFAQRSDQRSAKCACEPPYCHGSACVPFDILQQVSNQV